MYIYVSIKHTWFLKFKQQSPHICLLCPQMENYRKCRTEAFPPVCPFSDLPPDTPQVQVKDGSKIRNLLRFALSRMESSPRAAAEDEGRPDSPKDDGVKGPHVAPGLLPCGHIVFTATGKGVSKAITCAEIMKRRVKGLHQLTRLLYATVSEVWEPLKPTAGLDSLSVSRKVPAVWILLCREAPDRSQPGYQAPGCYNALWTQTSNREEGGALTEPKAGNKRKRGGGGGGGRGRGRSLSGRSRDTMKGQNR